MSIFEWRRTEPSTTVQILVDEFFQIHGEYPSEYKPYREAIEARAALANLDATGALRDAPTSYDKTLAKAEEALRDNLHAANQGALCLSGGGIRSAAFALGVLQSLARDDILPRFHYLSTVSGGGYIGAWLSAWIAKSEHGWEDVQEKLKDDTGTEPDEIRHLREYSRYLTPKSGLLSGDTWAALAIWIRNLLLNWLLILPLIGALVMLPKLVMTLLTEPHEPHWAAAFVALAAVSYLFAVMVLASNRPRWTRRNLDRSQLTLWYQVPLLISALAWLAVVAFAPTRTWECLAWTYVGLMALIYAVAWAWAITGWRWSPGVPLVFIAPAAREQHPRGVLNYNVWLSRPSRAPIEVWAFTEDRQAVETIHFVQNEEKLTFAPGDGCKKFQVHLAVGNKPGPIRIRDKPITTDDIRVALRQRKQPGEKEDVIIARAGWVSEAWLDGICAVVRGIIVGLLLATAHVAFAGLAARHEALSAQVPLLLLAFPSALVAHLIGAICFAGLNNKTPKSENDREWHGRLDGFAIAIALVWMLWVAVALVLPYEVITFLKSHGIDDFKKIYTTVTVIGGVAGTTVAWIGQGAGTPATSESKGTSWTSRFVQPAAAIFFVVCLFALISLGLDNLLYGPFLLTFKKEGYCHHFGPLPIFRPLILVATLTALPFALGFAINVNRFSLHLVYRNRLVRAFLGASQDWHRAEPPERFTGFRDSDNIELQRLWDRRRPDGNERWTWRPFHVINMALNVVSSKNLALKDRKALPFVATPLWCGAAALDCGRGAFRRTSEFGGEEKTITVGTAMAISGAAVSPNMGYNSSSLISFLLTLFNVRLGWWYGNPINGETYRLEGPRWAIKSLVYEAFGLTNETRPYIYLSDGGHFENLGLYEMVRRRCHFIVVVDADQDPGCGFEDLANALSRIMIDFGIRISIDLNDVRVRNNDRFKPNDGGKGFAFGTIHYGEVDEGARDGTIIYVKPSFRGDEPISVLGYANKSKDFPHEPTLDQWFSETQFESYRALGFATMQRVSLLSDLSVNRPRPPFVPKVRPASA